MDSSTSAAYLCRTCGFELWTPIVRLRVSTLALYDDNRYPGRCLLALNEHHEQLHELPNQLLHDLTDDVTDAGRAIQAATKAPRLNFAVLGNAVPHVHYHIVPRSGKGAKDPVPNRTPWENPEVKEQLEPALKAVLVNNIANQLAAYHVPQPWQRPENQGDTRV